MNLINRADFYFKLLSLKEKTLCNQSNNQIMICEKKNEEKKPFFLEKFDEPSDEFCREIIKIK